jgi:ribosomal protein S18 acetylase RimI-like enzyme
MQRIFKRSDLPQILAAEALEPDGLTEEDIVEQYRDTNVMIVVFPAADDVTLMGYAIYAYYKRKIYISRLLILPAYRRAGIGSEFIKKLKLKLTINNHRQGIVCEVPERNLVAQLFLRKNSFLAESFERDFYENSGQGAIFFSYINESLCTAA